MSDTSDRPAGAHGVHLMCYLLVVVLFVLAAVERHRRTLVFQDRPPVEPDRVAQLQTRVDPNTAGWAELARLPNVGASLARSLVAYREERRAKDGSTASNPSPPFQSLEDLDAVPGIGPRTLHQIAPYLKFPQ